MPVYYIKEGRISKGKNPHWPGALKPVGGGGRSSV